ncbi:MAG: NAD-dependent epimerase/dehydratase family protein [Gemmatimonadales bacterium]
MSVPQTTSELDEIQSQPRDNTVTALSDLPGDIVVLGAGGKMGPTLARMAHRALQESPSPNRRVIAVSRFSDATVEQSLRDSGIETIACDLLNADAVALLPDAPSVVYLAGRKFGTENDSQETWRQNVAVPTVCVEHYAGSRIVVFSSGNVYPLVPHTSGGSTESDPTDPVGTYAMSCVGREGVFEFASRTRGTPVTIMRLNYAIDLHHGVLTDLAIKIVGRDPIPLSMGYINIIWQRDANRAALELLAHAQSPPLIVNVTGPEILSVRDLARRLGKRLHREPLFEGEEEDNALLSDTSRMHALLGPSEMDIETMLDWVADWVGDGRPVLDRPTHFETRDGSF